MYHRQLLLFYGANACSISVISTILKSFSRKLLTKLFINIGSKQMCVSGCVGVGIKHDSVNSTIISGKYNLWGNIYTLCILWLFDTNCVRSYVLRKYKMRQIGVGTLEPRTELHVYWELYFPYLYEHCNVISKCVRRYVNENQDSSIEQTTWVSIVGCPWGCTIVDSQFTIWPLTEWVIMARDNEVTRGCGFNDTV